MKLYKWMPCVIFLSTKQDTNTEMLFYYDKNVCIKASITKVNGQINRSRMRLMHKLH